MVVLNGELAVPYNLQSAIAGLTTDRRYDADSQVFAGDNVEDWAHYRCIFQTPSGPEGSSGKKWYV